jgi:hypothetical protein
VVGSRGQQQPFSDGRTIIAKSKNWKHPIIERKEVNKGKCKVANEPKKSQNTIQKKKEGNITAQFKSTTIK